MSQNLDPEAIDKFNESMRELNNNMPSFILGMSQMMGVASGSVKASDALKNLSKNAKELTAMQEAEAQTQKKKDQIDANRNTAQTQATDALQKFAHGLTDTSTEFAKFNGALGSAGDAALSIGKNFGLLGLAAGALIKATTMAAQAATKQADNALKATDEFNKMGAAGGHTAKSIAEMGINIGLSNEQFALMPKALKKAGDGIVSLGATTADGQKKFMAMLAVTNQQREAFQRLGINQEELMEKQAEYIALQGMSGKSLVGQAKDSEKLKKSSLEYTENLLRLSALTGKDADKIAKDQQIANMAYEEVIQTRIEDDKIRKLTQEGKLAEAKSLEDEQKARKQFIGDATSRFGEETGLQLAKVMRTGAFDESTKGIAQLGIDATEVAAQLKKAKPGEEVANLFNDTYKTVQTKVSQNLAAYGTSLQFEGGEERGKAVGLNKELITKTGRTAERDEKEAERLAKLNIGKPSDGKTGKISEDDPTQKYRNALTTTTIEANRLLEKTLLAGSPLMNGINLLTGTFALLTAAAVASSVALGAMALKSTIGKTAEAAGNIGNSGGGGILDKIFGGGAPSGGGAPGAPSAPNGSAKGGRTRDAKGRFTKAPAIPTATVAGSAGEGSKVMAMVGDAGPALAKLGPGVGEGAAGFLKAFANPQVVLGAAGLGASIATMIATIGAGIAGASWIMGKALPTLMEGIQSFEKLDGQKLSATGTGILDLGKGLAVFGVGGAAAGIGNIAQNMSEGITAFFGGKTPIDKLVEFSKLDIDGPKTKSNAEAFVAFGEAMAKTGLGTASSGIGNLAGNIADGINKMFGKKDAIEKFVEFSKLQVDPKKTKEMAEAFRAYAEGINALSSSPSTGSKPVSTAPTTPSAPTATAKAPATPTAAPVATAPSTTPSTTPPTAIAKAPATPTAAPVATAPPTTPVATAKTPPAPVAMGNEGRRTTSAPTAAPVATATNTPKPSATSVAATESWGNEGRRGSTSSAPTAAPAVTATKTPTSSTPVTTVSTTAPVPTAVPVAMATDSNKVSKPSSRPPEESGPDTSAKAVDLAKILKFGSNSGSKENFEGLQPSFKDAVIAAATEYNAVTGNMIMINSAKRASEDQQRIWDASIAAGTPGISPTGMPIGKPGRSLHERGEAVDIQNYKDPAAITAFNKQGLTQKVPRDPVHFQASEGAMVSGSASGYPVEATFHGNEIVAPLDPESILTKLSKTSVAEMQKETVNNSSSSSSSEILASSNAEMIDLMKMFVEKMDDFIDAQSDSNSIQSELLQYSKV